VVVVDKRLDKDTLPAHPTQDKCISLVLATRPFQVPLMSAVSRMIGSLHGLLFDDLIDAVMTCGNRLHTVR
jgi:hypothetical protein